MVAILLEPSTLTVEPFGTAGGTEKEGVGVCASTGSSVSNATSGLDAVSRAKSIARLRIGVFLGDDVRCGIGSKSFWNTL